MRRFMDQVRTTVTSNGRIHIPAAYRRSLGLKEGDKVSLQIEEGVLKVITQKQKMEDVQKMVARFDKGSGPMVNDFLSKRKMDDDS